MGTLDLLDTLWINPSPESTDAMLRDDVTLPDLDTKSAYFLGLLLGDGFASEDYNHLVYLVGHLTDERDFYDHIIVPLIEELFNIKPRVFVKRGQNAYAACFGSVKVIAYLKKIGFPLISFRKTVPTLVLKAPPQVTRAFLQGLFDADGCLVFSKKSYLTYSYPTVEIKSVHREITDYIARVLTGMGFRASVRKSAESWVASVNGNEQMEKWMTEIGSLNIKHLSKFLLYRRLGSCPPHTTTPGRLQQMGLEPESFYPTLARETGVSIRQADALHNPRRTG